MRKIILSIVIITCVVAIGIAEQPSTPATEGAIPAGSKVFVASMPDNFDQYIKAAIDNKKVPVTLVEKQDDADFEITGYSETQKAGLGKKLIMGRLAFARIGQH
jgi:hypothetical protein